MSSRTPPPEHTGFVADTVRTFLSSHLSAVLLAVALAAGVVAIVATAREDEPQIVVPFADVFVRFPGASAAEVERLVARPLENYLWQIDGVEHVYSQARRGMAVVTVRFFVGQDRERSLVKLQTRVAQHLDRVPPGVTGWVVKPIEIDDVPVVTLALYSKRLDGLALRRVGEEVLARLEDLTDLSRTEVVGGYPRVVRVEPDPARLAGHGLTVGAVARALAAADAAQDAGSFARDDQVFEVAAGPFFATVQELRSVVVGVHGDRPVHLEEVASVTDGPPDPASYSRICFGPARITKPVIADEPPDASYEQVTLAISKKKGTNAVAVAERVLERIEELKREVIPADVKVLVTRQNGLLADRKVDELLAALRDAILSVVVLVALSLGWYEALVVALSVPVSFALTLLVNLFLGFTINRVTLFALILSLGLVVDDPVMDVENIQRHLRMGGRKPEDATLDAVMEVRPPIVIATLAIIISFLPLYFITDMMGPYMAPMAINVPLAMFFSLVCSVTFVPWLTVTLLRRRYASVASPEGQGEHDPTPPWIKRAYRSVVQPLIASRRRSWALLGAIGLLLAASCALALLRFVPLKMLPFDNKNELLLVVDMPEGTTLERTDATVRKLEGYLRTVPEVSDVESFVGLAAPIDFNGMVRHYYLRQGPHVADVRVNLEDKETRQRQSHAVCLAVRDELTALARSCGADLKIVEVPPGPPVLSTLVAEIYGRPGTPYAEQIAAAQSLREVMAGEPGVVEVDDMTEAPRSRLEFRLDREKAALHGVGADAVVASLSVALGGQTVGLLHAPDERHPLRVEVRLSEPDRSGEERLLRLEVAGRTGRPVALAELGRFERVAEDQPIFHKDLRPVVFVTAETAGRAPGEAVLDLQAKLRREPLPQAVDVAWAGEGEWQVTLRVFRDMGLAYAAAVVGIFLLLNFETGSFVMPLIIMSAIPLTAIGVLPGFWLLNLVMGGRVGAYADPVFFTATGMIGMIALGGIVVRNTILLIEFIHNAQAAGMPLRGAILAAGAVRMRPIVLTALCAALGCWPITFDPVFSGLAWTLIMGLLTSTAFTLVVVPVVYNLVYGGFTAEAAREDVTL